MSNTRADQVEAHLAPGALRVHIYHGADRETDPEALAAFDIVVRFSSISHSHQPLHLRRFTDLPACLACARAAAPSHRHFDTLSLLTAELPHRCSARPPLSLSQIVSYATLAAECPAEPATAAGGAGAGAAGGAGPSQGAADSSKGKKRKSEGNRGLFAVHWRCAQQRAVINSSHPNTLNVRPLACPCPDRPISALAPAAWVCVQRASFALVECAVFLRSERRRIVLDEAHTIRNRKTKTYRAALALRGLFRWCLTGTPVMNGADDTQPLFAFLRSQPLEEWGVWTRAVGRPVRDGDEAGLALLRLVLRSVSLRRTKEILSGQIPPKTVEIHRVVRAPPITSTSTPALPRCSLLARSPAWLTRWLRFRLLRVLTPGASTHPPLSRRWTPTPGPPTRPSTTPRARRWRRCSREAATGRCSEPTRASWRAFAAANTRLQWPCPSACVLSDGALANASQEPVFFRVERRPLSALAEEADSTAAFTAPVPARF